ncbi:ArsA family ATPase [Anoxynatronum sibiricum]|uniref:ArsA family ATPase n=1 Tax=Anoxynatronum sibiricum TaxID=210623 RepID=A0ABU9VVU4_9CLOT
MARFVFFGGKGGVGKTSCAAAFALLCANNQQKTLLVSTDPAHSLADLFHACIGGEVTELAPFLFGMEINPAEESTRYINRVKNNLIQVVSPVILEEIEKQLDAASISPGSEEAALFDKMVEIINENGNDFDQVVFDTAPTGHTLRLMALPELLGAWLDRLMEKRRHALKLSGMAMRKGHEAEEIMAKDPVLTLLNNRKTNLEKAREVLLDRQRLRFVFVLNPERLPVEETAKAVGVLAKHGIPVNDLVVNRILPEDQPPGFWQKRKAIESSYLSQISQQFPAQRILHIPLMEMEIDETTLEQMAVWLAPLLEIKVTDGVEGTA